jgi:hypothetical protein
MHKQLPVKDRAASLDDHPITVRQHSSIRQYARNKVPGKTSRTALMSSAVQVSVSKAHTGIQRVFAQLQASDFALKLQARPRNRGCDSVHLAETQTTRSGPEDLVIPSHNMREKSRVAHTIRD